MCCSAAVHEDTAYGGLVLAIALKLYWQRTQDDTELAWLVTLDALSTFHARVSSASTTLVVHHMVLMVGQHRARDAR